MLAETLALVTAANAAIGQVKTLIAHGSDISSMGKQLGAILTAEETLKAQHNTKKKSLISKAFGSDESSWDTFMEMEKLKEAKAEIESMMRLYGRPGLYDDWVAFQAQERVRKKQEAEEREKARAALMVIFQWILAALAVFGSAFGLLYWVYLTYG